MFIAGGGFRQLAGFMIHIMVALCRAVDAIGPVQASIEPLRAVGRGHLARQHQLHFIQIGAGVSLSREVAAFPAPVGPCTGKAPEDLLGGRLATITLVLRHSLQRRLIGHAALEECRNAFFFHRLGGRGDTSLAKVLLRNHVRGNLAPTARNFDIVELEDNCPIRIADFRYRGCEIQVRIDICAVAGKSPFNLHLSASCLTRALSGTFSITRFARVFCPLTVYSPEQPVRSAHKPVPSAADTCGRLVAFSCVVFAEVSLCPCRAALHVVARCPTTANWRVQASRVNLFLSNFPGKISCA